VDVHVPDAQLRLVGVVPSPVGRIGSVQFSLPRAGRAEISLYSVSGQRVRTLADRDFHAGLQSVPWDGLDNDGRAIPSGIYFVRLATGGRSLVSRAVVVR
jgi:flagellar hook assembly protein FlgD